ncbi:CfaE/CblD family pilus tip adhesin [Serratia fonticola]|uniref:CfaE/CblD family pilus tip adhesin n=1 Tax=Serratia fonticola TaxID=47917 RepID=UPI0015C66F83|nr:CfaE/CblD family pilus tip adhesin [Serratia fonticola]NXZ87793.1 phage tail protein [Serratia fonticola]
MKKCFYRAAGFALACLASAPCLAVYEAPMARNTTLTATYDRMSVPTKLVVWDNLSGGRDDTDGNKWGANTLVSLSATDATFGAGATEPKNWIDAPPQDWYVRLKFSLEGTSTSVDLLVRSSHTLTFLSPASCTIYGSLEYAASSASSCPGLLELTNLFSYYIAQGELAKLTLPGVWTATLKQNLTKWYKVHLNLWTASIRLTVTDLKSQQIYFPAFPGTAPRVNLNLSNRPGTQNNTTAAGSASLDMCLYDGSNSSSTQINMIFRDEGAAATGRAEGMFSVYREGGDKGQASNRLDYRVSVVNPTTGAVQGISNGTEIVWNNTNKRNIQRQVVLPGVPGVSLCVPAPITLFTPTFKLADKAAGRYTGRLTVVYTPSTQTAGLVPSVP